MKVCHIIVLTLVFAHSTAQRLTPEFGTLTDSDKSMTSYAAEPEASAVVLFDIGDSYFYDTDQGYEIRFTRMRRLKILTRAGIDYATVQIPFFVESPSKKEKVVTIEAYTYTLRDGLVYKKQLDPATVYEEEINNRWRVKKFVFPDVQAGSIIEYKYVLETPFHFNLPDWEFQSRIPTVYSEYTVSMIPFYEYIYLAQGIVKFDFQKSEVSKKQRTWGAVTDALGGAAQQSGFHFNDMVHTYAMKNIPSFSDESFITSVDDYIMKMDFQLSKLHRPTGGSQNIITTWPELNKALLVHEFFGKYLNSAERLAKKMLEKEVKLAPDLPDDKKCEALVEFTRTHFRWEKQLSYFASKSAREFVEQRHGNIADINLFLTALLRSAGLQADPVIISTRSHGKIKTDYPFGHYFNAVIVLVSGQRPFLTDATENLLAFDRIPVRAINEKGLIVAEGDARWVNLDPRAPSLEEITIQMNLDPRASTARVTGKITATQYLAYEYKSQFQNDSSRFRKHLEEAHHLRPVQTKFLSFDQAKLPYVMMFTADMNVEQVRDNLIVQPLLGFPPVKSPFQSEIRTYPVDYVFTRASRIKSSIQIPAGYKVTALPEPLLVENDLAQLVLKAVQEENSIQMQADFMLKKSVYSSSDYGRLRNLYTIMVKGFNTPIVLEKN